MRLLGAHESTLRALCDSAIEIMAPQYPELNDSRERILSIASGEENAFAQTLMTGNVLFDSAAAETKKSGSSTISGEKAFALHDTYGFPHRFNDWKWLLRPGSAWIVNGSQL